MSFGERLAGGTGGVLVMATYFSGFLLNADETEIVLVLLSAAVADDAADPDDDCPKVIPIPEQKMNNRHCTPRRTPSHRELQSLRAICPSKECSHEPNRKAKSANWICQYD
jgi:hypothetical protein